MGDILRAERNKPGSLWAEEIEYHMREGGLVPSELSMKLLQSHISTAMEGGRKKFILDGFPRKIEQAILFEKKVRRCQKDPNRLWLTSPNIGSCKAAVFLQCPKEKMIERLLERSKTSERIDDNVFVFEKRYEGYLKDSLPVVEHLKNVNVRVIEVSCDNQHISTKELNRIDIFSRKRRTGLDRFQRCTHGIVKEMP